MDWLTRLLRREQLETQLDAELRDHFERLVLDYVHDGLSEPAARRRARLEFGGLDQIKELCRDARGTRWFDELTQDVRYGWRGLHRNRSFAIVAVLTLALGVGANTAVFGVIHALFLRPLPVPDPDGLISLQRRVGPVAGGSFSYPQVLDLSKQRDMFKALCGFGSDQVNVGPAGAMEPALAAWVSAGYHSTLYDPFWDEPRYYTYYDANDTSYWDWKGESDARIHLAYQRAGKNLAHDFTFHRKKM